MSPVTQKLVLLRVGSAKDLTRSIDDGMLREGGSSQQYYV